MQKVIITESPKVQEKLLTYPKAVQEKLFYLKQLILKVAETLDAVEEVEETLKWGEPSYVSPKGSTIRMDWKPKNPDQYAMYFNCNTSLVETFKFVYGDLFRYEKNRAIIFQMQDTVPEQELQECIGLALQYHLLKDQPFLGT